MTRFVIDAQLPPSLARLLSEYFDVVAEHVEDIGLREARDIDMATWALGHGCIVITKDHDFVSLAHAGRIPGVLLLTCGNVSNSHLRDIMSRNFGKALALIEAGDRVVEMTG